MVKLAVYKFFSDVRFAQHHRVLCTTHHLLRLTYYYCDMSDQTYQASYDGTISWDLIFNYDNSTNSGTIREKLTITTTESLDYTSFEQTFNETVRKELEKNHVGSEVGASYEGITAKLDASIDISTEITDTLQETTSSTFKSNYSKTTTYERDGECGSYRCSPM